MPQYSLVQMDVLSANVSKTLLKIKQHGINVNAMNKKLAMTNVIAYVLHNVLKMMQHYVANKTTTNSHAENNWHAILKRLHNTLHK
jgi:uncharacterized phage-associated protein